MSFTKIAPAGIGTNPGTSIRIGDSLLHSTGIDIGTGTGIGVTIRQHGDATFTGIVTAVSFSGSGANLTGIDATSIKHTDGNVKIQAINTGANVTGNLSVSGNLGIAGVLTYEDVTNIDSVGVVTARSGIKIGPTAGVAGTFFADGSYVTAGIITAGSYRGDGSQLSGIAVGGASSITFNDNVGLHFGAGNANGTDLEIIHEPSALVTSFKMEAHDAQFSKRNGNKVARFSSTGRTYLYYNNSLRLETTSSGITLDGDISIADKIVHTGDTHTAIRFAGNDIITAEIAGSETLRIDGTGLKIADKLLHSGDVDTAIRFPAADTITAETGGSERFRITPSGTAVFGGDTSTPIVDNGELFYRGNSTSTFGFPQNFYLYSDNIAYNGTNPGAGLLFGGAYNSSAAYTTFSGIHGIKENNTDGNVSGALVFGTRQNGSGTWERLRIDATGRITQNGTTSVDTGSALTLKNGHSSNDHTILEVISDPNQYSMIYMGASDDRHKGRIRYKDNDHFMDFYTNNEERMKLYSNGKVGINTDSTAVDAQVYIGSDPGIPALYSSYGMRIMANGDHNKRISNATGIYALSAGITGNNNWHTVAIGRYHAATVTIRVGDASSKRSMFINYDLTAPNYGVAHYNVIANNGQWNTGSADFQITSSGSYDYALQVRHNSYYNSSNNSGVYMIFNVA